MSGSAPTEKFKNKTVQWINDRLPIFSMMQNEYGKFPAPKNFNYFWNFGAIAMAMLGIMILTGIFLAMNYVPNDTMAFESVERMTRDVNYGWLMRYVHMNGASFFFIAVYIHIFRGLFYGSYKKPREMVWIFGVLIMLLMMATAFMGYALPWSQMSGWGTTVITSLFGAIPFVGDGLTHWLWGGFTVGNPTLNRFYALHFLLPFVILGVVFVHVWALHVTGSNNPTGVEPKSEKDTVPFHPYYTTKDSFGTAVFLIFFFAVAFFAPLQLAEPDHFRQFDPMQTPPHIVPEWYFLPFYAILRSFTVDLTPVLVLFLGSAGGLLFSTYALFFDNSAAIKKSYLSAFFVAFMALVVIFGFCVFDAGTSQALPGFVKATVMSAKLQGVIAMFGSIILLFFLPWLDTSPVRSARYRPIYKWCLILLVFAMGTLTYAGGQLPQGWPVVFGRIATFYYFFHFLVIVPVLGSYKLPAPGDGFCGLLYTPVYKVGKMFGSFVQGLRKTDTSCTIPDSISDDVIACAKKAALVLAFAGTLLAVSPAMAADAAPAKQATASTTPAAAPAKAGAPATTATAATAPAAAPATAAAPAAESAATPAATEEQPLAHLSWPENGVFGTYDKAALQRGFQIYKEVCSACHSMKFVYYRNLEDLGYKPEQIKSLAATYTVTDGPGDDGEMFERPARPSDHLKSPYKNDKAARASNGGALPPDMSLLVKAREGGEDYIYGILTGYGPAPANVTMMPGLNYNKTFPGHQIAMPQPMTDGRVTFTDGTSNSLDQEARDVAQFLAWASEPQMEQRKRTGIKVILFMLVFAGVLLNTKRKVWSKLH